MRDKISLFTLITSFFFSGSFVNSEKAPATFAIRSIWSSIEAQSFFTLSSISGSFLSNFLSKFWMRSFMGVSGFLTS